MGAARWRWRCERWKEFTIIQHARGSVFRQPSKQLRREVRSIVDSFSTTETVVIITGASKLATNHKPPIRMRIDRLMSSEERQRMMELILAQQAQFWAGMQKLEESQAKFEESQKRADERINNGSFRMDRLERILKLIVRAGMRARTQMRETDERFEQRLSEQDQRYERRATEQDERFEQRLTEQANAFERRFSVVSDTLAEIAECQKQTDIRLYALIDTVREQRNSSI